MNKPIPLNSKQLTREICCHALINIRTFNDNSEEEQKLDIMTIFKKFERQGYLIYKNGLAIIDIDAMSLKWLNVFAKEVLTVYANIVARIRKKEFEYFMLDKDNNIVYDEEYMLVEIELEE